MMGPRQAYAGTLSAGQSTTIPRNLVLFLFLPVNFTATAVSRNGQEWLIDLVTATNSQIPIPGWLWGELEVTQGSVNYVFLPRGSFTYSPIIQGPSAAAGSGFSPTLPNLELVLNSGGPLNDDYSFENTDTGQNPAPVPVTGLYYFSFTPSGLPPVAVAFGIGPTEAVAVANLSAALSASAYLILQTGATSATVFQVALQAGQIPLFNANPSTIAFLGVQT